MRKRYYYLRLTDAEHRFIIQCLLNYRNKLISQGTYTDGVDELILKYSKHLSLTIFIPKDVFFKAMENEYEIVLYFII